MFRTLPRPRLDISYMKTRHVLPGSDLARWTSNGPIITAISDPNSNRPDHVWFGEGRTGTLELLEMQELLLRSDS